MESLPAAFLLLAPSVPLVAAYAAGIILALLKMGDCRLVSAFALAGFIGLLLGTLIHGAGLLMTLPEYRGDTPIKDLAIKIAVTNYMATFLTVAATVLLIVAIFTDRERQEGVRSAGIKPPPRPVPGRRLPGGS